MIESLSNILANFPSTYIINGQNNQQHITFAFGYGSGVLKQQQDIKKSTIQNQIDLIFVVNNSFKFHEENLKLNPHHYSFLRHFGVSTITRIQETRGARIYFNPYIKFNNDSNTLYKYGIISRKHLIRDLLDWETLYVAGRLQKPVSVIQIDQNDQDLIYALKTNLNSALHVALLLLPEEFTLKDLFLKITALSYQGDFRMYIGENKNKISNIVLPQIDLFINLYSNLILNDTHLHWNKNRTLDTIVKQDVTPIAIFTRLLALPKHVINNIMELTTLKTRQYQDTEEVIRKLCLSTQRTEKIEYAVRSIVKRSSLTQTFKGLLTAGFIRSTRYALAKLKKMIR
ncbi:unnamed protein product [Rotaria sordida]|uniref:Phosphatidate cytidylyltransferase, mitochondrial n=1 Tax=Rotaria sordida TaxID=392033 RepID=A0A813T157_9BILA|nr:unnamed protein product [Rotaria sordida]CAF0759837.1 unnamed protein product [Rotaria sordida]CAF0761178.1 unnamed protein product [Rotaria sordida]CAF0802575.1 unnamed protein product [Rotaria sordida]CAF3533878.1 unnamed protein product [Rotaria sordida]